MKPAVYLTKPEEMPKARLNQPRDASTFVDVLLVTALELNPGTTSTD